MSGADTLVVGLGSIGSRHAEVLRRMGRKVVTVSKRGAGDHRDIASALCENSVTYAVVANETASHADALRLLAAADFKGQVLVEKPLLLRPEALPEHEFTGAFVGYNLRFHPALIQLASLLQGDTVLSAAVYVGQYLPDWRPGRDYRTTSSAQRAAGGGVLRDLSHELDYLLWLFGPWRRVAAIGPARSVLSIETEESVALLIECERCPAVTVQLNYHFRRVERRVTVATSKHGISVDMIAGTVAVDGEVGCHPAGRDETYAAMHRAILDRRAGACDLSQGLAVVELIDAIERAISERRWIAQ